MQSKTWIKDYIGKAKKKIEKSEELDKLTASIPENWKEACTQLNNIIGQITPLPNWNYDQQNWNYNQQTIKFDTIDFQITIPVSRFFTPSNNGVHFPCL